MILNDYEELAMFIKIAIVFCLFLLMDVSSRAGIEETAEETYIQDVPEIKGNLLQRPYVNKEIKNQTQRSKIPPRSDDPVQGRCSNYKNNCNNDSNKTTLKPRE